MSIVNGCDYYCSCEDCECSHCLVVKQREKIKRLKYRLRVSKIANERLENDNERLDKNNVVLQKQINELKEQRDVFKRLFESANTSNFTTNSIIETMNSFYREQAEHLAELKIKQVVKEILQEGKYCLSKSLQNWIKEHYGVNAE